MAGSLQPMSSAGGQQEAQRTEATQAPPIPIYLDARRTLAEHFLFGEGLEIGPLHQPLAVPPHVTVRYVDRMKSEQLREEYPELAEWNLTPVDVIDDGEALATIEAESQDFIVANHFLEHCENPIGTIETHLGKLKPGGILFYAVPDKRFTFDFRRAVTPLDHMVADYEHGPERSRAEHYDEWARLVLDDPEEVATRKARELEEAGYSIHMHVWTQAEFLKLMLDCRQRSDDAFDIEAAARQGIEFMVVLRKSGPLPDPALPPSPQPLDLAARDSWRGRLRRALGSARRELRRPAQP
jgi:hypothetical protein